jgi:hypothetical protein
MFGRDDQGLHAGVPRHLGPRSRVEIGGMENRHFLGNRLSGNTFGRSVPREIRAEQGALI